MIVVDLFAQELRTFAWRLALTLPLVPVFAVLVGLTTRDRARTQWRALEALSGHFLDVVRVVMQHTPPRLPRSEDGETHYAP